MANPYDQFDATGGNPYDRFDSTQPEGEWAKPSRSVWDDAKRQAGLAGRALINAAASPATLAGDAVNKFINGATGVASNFGLGQQTNLQMPSQMLDRGETAMGLPQARGKLENFPQSVARSAPAFALPGGWTSMLGGNAAMGAAEASPGHELAGAAEGAGGALLGAGLAKTVFALGRGAANVLGLTTGAGGESVKQAFRGGPGFEENMRGTVPGSDVVEAARTGVGNMRQQMYDAYKNAKGGWASDNTPLDFRPIGQAYNNAASKFSFQGVPQPGVAAVKDQTEALMTDWLTRAQKDPKFLTVEGLDALKRHLGTIVPGELDNRAGRAFVSEVTDAVKKSIIAQRPEYATAMKDYWSRSEQLDEISRSLSLGDKATVDTALRKLGSVMRNNVNANFGQRLNSARTLEDAGGVDLLPALAGQALNSWTPRGLASSVGTGAGIYGAVAKPSFIPGLAVMSPRTVGEVANLAGKAARKVNFSDTITDPRMAAFLAAMMRGEPEQ